MLKKHIFKNIIYDLELMSLLTKNKVFE